MQITDPIADLLTRIRNASSAKHATVDIPASNMKKAIVEILLSEGYIKSYQIVEDGKQGIIRITLKYDAEQNTGYLRHQKSFQARPEDLLKLRGYAQGHEGSRSCDSLHLQGHHHRQAGKRARCRRRNSRFRLVRRLIYVKNRFEAD